MKTVILTRNSDNGKQTLGTLEMGTFQCKTLERPWKDNKPSISAIPKGVYASRWTFSPKLMRYTYQVINVPGRSGIRFHKGNYFFDIEGCILLGTGYMDINHDGQVDLINSTITMKRFEQILNKEPFNLIIQ